MPPPPPPHLSPPSLLQLAMQAHQVGDLNKAHSFYRQFLAQNPDHPQAIHLLGMLAFQTGNPQAALNLINRAIALRPGTGEFHANAALALVKLNRLDEANTAYQRAVELDPKLAKTHINMGSALAEQGQIDPAIACFQRALVLNSNGPEAHYNLGNTYKVAGRLEEAAEEFRLAAKLRPDWPQAAANLSHALCRLGRFDEALAERRAAAQRMPDSRIAHFAYAASLLMNGDWEPGWREYEWRPQAPDPLPRWDGGDLNGKSILLAAEQGLGDTIQFIRYAPLLAQRGAQVTVAVQPELLSLSRCIPGVRSWISQPAVAIACDLFCPLASLPGLFGTTPQNIPAGIPYLKPDPALCEQWKRRLPTGKLKIGLVWAGRADQPVDSERSISLNQLAPLAGENTFLVSLQKGPASEQIAAAPFPIANWSADLTDFAQTAALIENLDVIVTVDSAVAHLAGAMGKPARVLLPLVPDWRWMLNRDDTPWYPTLRLFRQEKLGDWTSAVARVAGALHSGQSIR